MEMHQVRYFLAVAEDLNFTRAAERCNVAQPSLSRAVKLLEEELGGPLFHRERSQTHLSELGHMVRPHLELVFKEQQATKELARSFTSLKKTRLKLGVMCTIAPVQVTELLGTVIARYPGIDLEISDRSGLQLQEELLNGELEVAIYCVQDVPLDERLHFMPLFREQMVIVLHPQHKLASQNAVRPTDLHGDRYLKRVNCEFNSVAGKIFDEQGVVDETVYSCKSGCQPLVVVGRPGVVAWPGRGYRLGEHVVRNVRDIVFRTDDMAESVVINASQAALIRPQTAG